MEKRIEKYLELMQARSEEFTELGAYNIVTDPTELEKFDRENGPVGVVYSNRWINFVVDVIDDGAGKYIYSRIIPAQRGAGVVAVSVYDGKIAFIRHIRHAVRSREYMFELPRGFLDPDTDAAGQVVRELQEEIGAKVEEVKVIGRTIADGGQSGGEVVIAAARISSIGELQTEEGVIKCELLTEKEAENAVAEGKTIDGFTQTALYLYRLAKERGEIDW